MTDRLPGAARVLRALPLFVLLTIAIDRVVAQDTIPPIEQGVRLGITYTPGMRPGLLVLGGPHRELQDSARAILRRDLDYSDRFEMIALPGGDSLVLGVSATTQDGVPSAGQDGAVYEDFVNYSLYATLGADFAVSVLEAADSTLTVNVYDVRGEAVSKRVALREPDAHAASFRMAVHRAADEVVRVATAEVGVAASRITFVSHRRLYVIDSDGYGRTVQAPDSVAAFSPAWSPDGSRLAYTDFKHGNIRLRDLTTGTESTIPGTDQYMNYGAIFSPDGWSLVFSRSWDQGTDLFAYNLARDCCLQRLTVGRFSDNLSPAFSPDGRRIAFESTRSGLAQIYVMAADGTDQELFAPFDYGVTGDSHSPTWSPDGLKVAFHRTVAASPQIFVMDARTRTVRQLTSFGRNEDPSWGPDSRHLVFKSSRTGSSQVWVIDTETGRVRQLTRIGGTRFPKWSLRMERPGN
ncbi:MAG: hypothetical protein ACE5HT_00670 [Gemmatimonadales bacterium]